MEGTLQLFLCQATVTDCVIPLLRVSHPIPDQLPGEHTGLPSHVRQYLFVQPLLAALVLTHSR